MQTQHLVTYLNDLFEISEIEDTSLNGLQVANRGEVTKVALAVDASLGAFQKAIRVNADFLLVHHGLFWAKPFPITGTLYQRIRLLLESDIALYAVHLPLDLHPDLGNNAQIEKVLGWPIEGEFGEYHGNTIGREVRFKEPRTLESITNDLNKNLKSQLQVWDFGPKNVQRLAYVSGGGIDLLHQAIDAGMDAFITGEPKHSLYWIAKEAGINVILSGHYATETLGVKAVGKAIQEKFNLETVFIDLPTGL